jgi:hypothetical protein
MKRLIGILISISFLIFFTENLKATEFALHAGMENGGQQFYGLYVNWGFLPFISSEGEYNYNLDSKNKLFSAGLSGKFKLSFFAPFVRVGIGLREEEFSYSGIHLFYYLGGGLKFYLAPVMGLKAGVTLLNEKNLSYYRAYGGVFIEF